MESQQNCTQPHYTLIHWCQKYQTFYKKSPILLQTLAENEIRVRIKKYTNNKVLCINISNTEGKNIFL